MAEFSGFFDAHASVDAQGNVVYDRTYLAESFAKYFASFIGNGIYGGKSNELMVKQRETADMSVEALSGQAFINGYFYENTDNLSLAIDNADGVLDRIDLIVLRWNKYDRAIRLAVKKGSSSSSPSAPLLDRNDDYYELELARVNVKAGATRITQADITDMRLDSDVCGFVVAVINQFDTAEFHVQLQTWVEEFKVASVEEVEQLLVDLQRLLEDNNLNMILEDIQDLKDFDASLVYKTYDVYAPEEVDPIIEAELNSMALHTKRNICINDNVGDTVFFGGLTHLTINKVTDEFASIEAIKYHTAGALKWQRCKYRTWQEWEWCNPPFDAGVEYRTAKRRNGKVVYERLDADGVLRYRLEDSSTWAAYATENGAVKKTGDTMTNDLTIKKDAAPSLRLNENNSGAGAVLQLWGNQLIVANRISADVVDNYRYFSVNNLNMQDDVAYALGLADIRNGETKYYTVLHSGNLHVYGIGVAPATVE